MSKSLEPTSKAGHECAGASKPSAVCERVWGSLGRADHLLSPGFSESVCLGRMHWEVIEQYTGTLMSSGLHLQTQEYCTHTHVLTHTHTHKVGKKKSEMFSKMIVMRLLNVKSEKKKFILKTSIKSKNVLLNSIKEHFEKLRWLCLEWSRHCIWASKVIFSNMLCGRLLLRLFLILKTTSSVQ